MSFFDWFLKCFFFTYLNDYVTRYLQRSPAGSRAESGYREARARPWSGRRTCQSRATRIGLEEPLENRFRWSVMMRALAPLMTDPPR